MSKSLCTQQCYASSFRNQTQLDAFQFGAHPSTCTSLIPQHRRVSDRSTSSVESGEEVHIISDDDSDNRGVSIGPSIPESEISMHASDFPINPEQAEPEDNPSGESDSDEAISQQRAEDLETWQEELEQDVSN